MTVQTKLFKNFVHNCPSQLWTWRFADTLSSYGPWNTPIVGSGKKQACN